eukprot:7340420-Prymnesium_polylepis.1
MSDVTNALEGVPIEDTLNPDPPFESLGPVPVVSRAGVGRYGRDARRYLRLDRRGGRVAVGGAA